MAIKVKSSGSVPDERSYSVLYKYYKTQYNYFPSILNKVSYLEAIGTCFSQKAIFRGSQYYMYQGRCDKIY
jgi:hypothetical protein